MKRIIALCILTFLLCDYVLCSKISVPDHIGPDKITKVTKTLPLINDVSKFWVDSVFNSLTPDERIGQLFMVSAWSNKDKRHVEEIANLIKNYKIGGLIFFQGGPVREAELTNYYQKLSKTPLLISIDGEWGLAMRLDSTEKYPKQMMLGAMHDDSLIYEMGCDIARQCQRIGIQINYAPVVDVNCNPYNPVINTRSFGEDKKNVSSKAMLYMAGLQNNHILAVAKHFPGHGDTDQDSHFTLPVIRQSLQRIDSVELYPFRELIKEGIGGVMVAHLNVPALDTAQNRPSTLSEKIINGLLKHDLGFKGLVFSDALSMKGVGRFQQPGTLEYLALKAGNDVLVSSEEIPQAIQEIKCHLYYGDISQEAVDSTCRKILAIKYWAGLNHYSPVQISSLMDDINTPQSDYLQQQIIESSLTLVSNLQDLIPLKRLDTLNLASVVIGNGKDNAFQKTLNLYAPFKHYTINKENSSKSFMHYIDSLAKYNVVVVGIINTDMRVSRNFGITQQTVDFIDSLCNRTNVVVDIFANPYTLSRFQNLRKAKAVVMSYEDSETTQRMSAQLIFGGIPAKGTLPVSTILYPEKTGIQIKDRIRLKYSVPEEEGMNRETLGKIDSVANDAIDKGAMPGCQILVARNGVVVYNKSFGYHTYEKKQPVTNDDIYDLASITKVSATLPSLMLLYDQGKFDFTKKLSAYLPELQNTNKKNIIIEDILTHQARLQPWIPFYFNTLSPANPQQTLFSKEKSEQYPYLFSPGMYVNKNIIYKKDLFVSKPDALHELQVADSLYLLTSYRDTMYNQINNSELLEKKEYKYSDLGFYYFQKLVEQETKTRLDSFAMENFYKPLGATTMGYLPLKRFSRSRIVPTENDQVFRRQLVHGYVHDPGAAMLGGVAGHAGLFASANDLAKLVQMYLQKGEYGGQQYFKPGTMDLFTTAPFIKKGNRRALGFDKPEMDYSKPGPSCQCVSALSFGHTGFTGTFAWADPESQIVYIFLSNRVNPDQNNPKLVDMNIRTKIQQIIYDSIED
ncbi:MAG: glycoside hydrolase family 3 N-terminal domain-containing protein [Bacteroidota bacterium]|nr:glycoside hydrolase family 3 N-terminal domain-containing protein [Bacteroidota bacterium]